MQNASLLRYSALESIEAIGRNRKLMDKVLLTKGLIYDWYAAFNWAFDKKYFKPQLLIQIRKSVTFPCFSLSLWKLASDLQTALLREIPRHRTKIMPIYRLFKTGMNQNHLRFLLINPNTPRSSMVTAVLKLVLIQSVPSSERTSCFSKVYLTQILLFLMVYFK